MTTNNPPSTTTADVHQIPTLLATLRQTPPPEGGVLSAYFATPLRPVAGRAYLVTFREGCKALRESLAPEVLKSFDETVARADRHLAESFVPRLPGLALLASPAGLTGPGSAQAAGEDVRRGTDTMQAKNSLNKTVTIGGELYTIDSSTRILAARGNPIGMGQLPVPEVHQGKKVPQGGHVWVRYEAVASGSGMTLRLLELQPDGDR